MFDLENLILDILDDLNTIQLTILSGQNGDKPPMPYAEINIIADTLNSDYSKLEVIEGTTDITKKYTDVTNLTLSITHHAKSNLETTIKQMRDYFLYSHDIVALENKYSMSIINKPSISNRDTVLNVEHELIKGFDVTMSIDDVVEITDTFIEEVDVKEA